MKLWDGWKVTHNGEETICKNPPEVWEMFGWDIENDKDANECAMMITREMYCFGHIDLSSMCNDGTLIIDIIPVNEMKEKADMYAEKYGIVYYDVCGKFMTYYTSYPSERCTYKCVVQLDNMLEIRTALDEYICTNVNMCC